MECLSKKLLRNICHTRRHYSEILRLCPDISGTWGSAFEADNSGWQSTGAVYSAKTGSLSMEIPDFSETREFIRRSFRATRYSGYYGASGVSVDATYVLMIIKA